MAYDTPEKSKAYYLRNKEKIKQRSADRYTLNKEEIKKYRRERYLTTSEKEKAQMRKYRSENRDTYRSSIDKWMVENKGAYKSWKKSWTQKYSKNNRAKIYAKDVKRRQAKKSSIDETTDLKKIAAFYRLAEECTLMFGEKYVVDHIKPICKGGKHHQDNLQVITLTDNLVKGSKYPFETPCNFMPSNS